MKNHLNFAINQTADSTTVGWTTTPFLSLCLEKNTVTAPDIRWQQRFSNYRKALGQLRRFIDRNESARLSDLEQQGLVKAFEYTYELAWTTLKDFLEFSGQKDIYGSRDATRKAFELGLIEDGGTWMDMLQSRNLTSHTYNAEIAEEICRAVIENYYPLFLALEDHLDRLLDPPRPSGQKT